MFTVMSIMISFILMLLVATIIIISILLGRLRRPSPPPAAFNWPPQKSFVKAQPNSPPSALITRINHNGDINDPATPHPLLTLEEFFTGNTDNGSIGGNLRANPSPQEFYAFLKQVRTRPEVVDVRVEVTRQNNPAMWPFSDTVWVITSVAPDVVLGWFPARLRGDKVIDGFASARSPLESCHVPPGMRAVGVRWD